MKKLRLKVVEKYIEYYNSHSKFGGLYIANDGELVGDAYGPMGPGRYTPIDDFYWTIPLFKPLKFMF